MAIKRTGSRIVVRINYLPSFVSELKRIDRQKLKTYQKAALLNTKLEEMYRMLLVRERVYKRVKPLK